ncbi:response regulator [Sneathiella sp. P13V-1]|uniref:ATP-binding protein n=1 Tax=Sneathiella sp. P13V-1 TaxID=2697366 RepID=UPI00187BA960|nr:ATP-binding protein [Sneathiella sp. P13V-1]MBE7635294.1 response regulator [Sneathiella sp. P13V-1]
MHLNRDKYVKGGSLVKWNKGKLLKVFSLPLFVIYFLISAITAPFANAETKPVLFISSYHPGFHSFFDQIEGLKEGLSAASQGAFDVDLSIEFMDTKRFPDQTNIRSFKARLSSKLEKLKAGKKPELIVVGDDNALDFALKEQEGLFEGLPIVFLGVNNVKKAIAQDENPSITGVVEHPSIGKTLDFAENLLSKKGSIYVITDDTRSGHINFDLLQAALATRDLGNRIENISLKDHTITGMLDKVSKIKSGSVILFLNAHRDLEGNTQTTAEAAKKLAQYSKVPYLHPWKPSLGLGSLGGVIVSHHEQGRVAGELAARILLAGSASGFEVVSESPNPLILDYNILSKFGISRGLIPKNAVLINRPEGLYATHKEWIIGGVIFILFQTFAIAVLSTINRKRKKAEAALRSSEHRFRDYAEIASDWYWEQDENLRFTYLSKRHHEVTGMAPDAFIGNTREEMIRKTGVELTEEFKAHLEQIKSHKSYKNFEYRFVRPDGEARFINNSGKAIFDSDSNFTGYRGIGRDVTEGVQAKIDLQISRDELQNQYEQTLEAQKRVEAQSRELAKLAQRETELREKAEVAEKSKSEFLASMSHEIRTPMTGVVGFADMLLEDKLAPESVEKVTRIKDAANALLTIINDILDISKLDANKLLIEDIDFNLEELMQDVVTLFSQTLPIGKQGKLSISYELDSDLPARINMDPMRLRQILINLVGNAVKFTESGEVILSCKIDQKNGRLRFEINDTGIGINEEALPNLFNEFTQADPSISRRYHGTGLGLSICKRLVNLMNGDIGARSIVGKGSCFWFSLPYKEAKEIDEKGQDKSTKKPTKLSFDYPISVLVAEDNNINQLIIKGLLKTFSIVPDIVANGAEAISAVEKKEYDIILMDIRMPVMSGVEATQSIRSMISPKRDIPIIALTADVIEDHKSSYLDAGINEVIAKPIDQAKLFEVLSSFTDKNATVAS